MAYITTASSAASIISLWGWAGEKFLSYAPEMLGLISFFVIGLIFLFALSLLAIAFIQHEDVKELQGDYILSHKITHNLRNSITDLQSLEFTTLKKIDKCELPQQFSDIKENDELKRKEIFKSLGAKTTGCIVKQIKNYFLCNGLKADIRVTIKTIVPCGSNQLKWQVATLVVDPSTWNNQNSDIDESGTHFIENNSDFEDILLGNKKVFSHNNLNSVSEKEYKNSSRDWRKRYNASMVVPIKNKPYGKDNTVYYGFLTVDSLNPKKQALFDSKENSPTLNILAHAADALAVWFIKNDNHDKLLGEAFEYREGTLILEQAITAKKNANALLTENAACN